MCWRKGRQAKQDLGVEPSSASCGKSTVSRPKEEEYRRRPPYYPDRYQYEHDYSEPMKAPYGKLRAIARPISTKRASSSSAAGHTTETKSTQADSTETPPSSKTSLSKECQDFRRNRATDKPLKRHPSRGPMKQRYTPIGAEGFPGPKRNMYVAIKPDSETVTALSMPDMDESRASSCDSPPRSVDSRSGRLSEAGYALFQPDGVLEATILRSDSDSTRDMSVMGAEFHLGVYNLSERMRYDLREAGRSLSTIATEMARSCIAPPKLIKK